MSRTLLWLLDERGISRPLLENWVPSFDPDVIWLVSDSDIDDDLARETVPVLPLSPFEIGAALAEVPDAPARVLLVFTSVDLLASATRMGIAPTRVTLLHARGPGERQSSQVTLDAAALERLRALAGRGFEFVLQPLPNVTGRALNLLTA